MSSAQLVIRRKYAFTNLMNRFAIFINGKEIGEISNDSTKKFNIHTGSITVGLDWKMQMIRGGLRSATFNNIKGGDVISIECIAKPGLFRAHVIILSSEHQSSS